MPERCRLCGILRTGTGSPATTNLGAWAHHDDAVVVVRAPKIGPPHPRLIVLERMRFVGVGLHDHSGVHVEIAIVIIISEDQRPLIAPERVKFFLAGVDWPVG